MGTKTVDEAGAATGTETKVGEEKVDGTEQNTSGEAAAQASPGVGQGVGQGAAGIVSVVLALVSLTGSWVGDVAQARNQMFGQLETAQNADVATMLQQYYGDSWNAGALVSGIFALVAMIVAVAVLVRPAFGDPDQVQAPWIKSVAWAGVAVGFIGLVLAVLKYSDILLGLPNT